MYKILVKTCLLVIFCVFADSARAAMSDHADLKSITVSNGKLSPAFSGQTTNYTLNADNTTTSFSLIPTAVYATSTIQINGKTVLQGKPSAATPIAVGKTIFKIVVTAADATVKTYTVTVNRAVASINNAKLASLSLNNAPFAPGFSVTVIKYSSTVAYTIASTKIKYLTSDAGATVAVNGKPYKSWTGSIPLKGGPNKIAIVVTAKDGKTTKTYTVTVSRLKTAQTISYIVTTKQYGDKDFIPAKASSKLPLTFTSSNSKAATIVKGKVHITGANPMVTITATQAGNGKYAAAKVTGVLIINKAPQHITFLPVTKKTVGDAPFSPAKVSSKLPVTYTSSNLNVAFIQDNKVVIKSAGTISLNASQPGNNNYEPAVSISQTFKILKHAQKIFFTQNSAYLGPLDFSPANATSGLNITYSSSDNSVAVITNNKLYAVGTGKVIITANQAGNYYYLPASKSQEITIIAGKQHIVFPKEESAYGSPDFAIGATTVSGLPVTYSIPENNVISLVNDQIHIIGAGKAVIRATQAGDKNYDPATAEIPVVIDKIPLNVRVDSKTIWQGGTFPTLTETFNGFVNGDDKTDLITIPVINTKASKTSAPGKYTATASGGKSNNYSFDYVAGIITITAPPAAPALNGIDAHADQLAAPVVHSSISPNGDGINDVLLIDNIARYADNKLTIMDKNGAVVYSISGYNNNTNVFDGHAANSGLLKPGTYYYLLSYHAANTPKRLTGYIIIKY